MTDPEMADATYIEPITPAMVAKIIEKERPDAVLPTMGGQTALNTALALFEDGTLEKYGVQMIGADADAIDKAKIASVSAKRWTRSVWNGPFGRRPRGRGSLCRAGTHRPAFDHPSLLHAGRHGRRHCL
jgi:hypothetical protein